MTAMVAVVGSLLLAGIAAAETQASCGSLDNPYGPYDFRRDQDKTPIVIRAHFTPMVEALIRGTTNTTPGNDIDYTLRAIPNHPKALLAMARLAEREKADPPRGSRYTVDCWFERALRFRPDDQVVRMLYAKTLIDKQRKDEALAHLNIVRIQYAKENPITYYNLGLLYVDIKEYELALQQAYKALELGHPKTELQEKLRALGRWQDPPAERPPSAPAN